LEAIKDTLSIDKIVCACGCGTVLDRYDKQGRERRFKSGHNGRITEDRSCSRCGKGTFVRKSGIKDWYHDTSGNLICVNCYNRIIHGDYRRFKNRFRFKYKGKIIHLDHDPRNDVCNWCRAVAPFDTPYTQRHHDERRYDDSDPLKNTIELCDSCHARERHRLGEIDKEKTRDAGRKGIAQILQRRKERTEYNIMKTREILLNGGRNKDVAKALNVHIVTVSKYRRLNRGDQNG